MKNSFKWQLYITAHTFLYGIPFLFFPNKVLPFLGFEMTSEPWIKISGMLFLVIGFTAITVYRHQIKAMLLPSIIVRGSICGILLSLDFAKNPVFFYILIVIIFIGLVGSSISYYTETKVSE